MGIQCLAIQKMDENVYAQLQLLRKQREQQSDERAVFESYTMQSFYSLYLTLKCICTDKPRDDVA